VPAPLAASQLSAVMTAASGPKKGASQHKKRVLKHADFKKIVGKFWSAMTDNGALEAVSFSLYFIVHARISKTLEPNFTEAEAKEVAEEDFKSDTQGKGFMRKSQLKHSLYELAMVWAQSQHDAASGTPEQIVFFLTELFGNIGEVLIVEGKRLVELKHLTEVQEVKAEMATNFRKKFRPRDEAKLKLLAAEEAAEAQRQRRLAAQARRRERTLSLAERLAAEALGAAHQLLSLGSNACVYSSCSCRPQRSGGSRCPSSTRT